MEIKQKLGDIRVILASASPRRRDLLRQIGLEPEILPSRIEEHVTKTEPDQVVMELSRQKASEVAARLAVTERGQCLVIGSDTVVSTEGRILGKPGDRAEAIEMIRSIQGKSHEVYTGVTLIYGERMRTFAVETRVEVYPMTEWEIEAYVDCGESMDKAGAYGIQGRFAAHIRGLTGSYTNVMGLPAGRVYQEMKKLLAEDAEDRA